MVENPIYTGVLSFGDERSEPFENLRIIDDTQFERCNEIVKGRSPKYYQQETIVPIRTDSRSLLTGILFCADCGSRMCYSHNVVRRKLADGTPRVYERNLYRCYKKVSSKQACSGQSAYDMEPINAAVEKEVKKFLKRLASKPREALLEVASARNEKSYQAALEQAEKEYANAQKQMNALEEEAVKALTGESQLDLSVVNTMILSTAPDGMRRSKPLRKPGNGWSKSRLRTRRHRLRSMKCSPGWTATPKRTWKQSI